MCYALYGQNIALKLSFFRNQHVSICQACQINCRHIERNAKLQWCQQWQCQWQCASDLDENDASQQTIMHVVCLVDVGETGYALGGTHNLGQWSQILILLCSSCYRPGKNTQSWPAVSKIEFTLQFVFVLRDMFTSIVCVFPACVRDSAWWTVFCFRILRLRSGGW